MIVESSTPGVVQRAREGDMDAFRSLVEVHWLPLVRFARSIVGESDAEDVVQDCFLVAWRKLRSLERAEAFQAWMLRIVARRCFRRAGRLARFLPWIIMERMPEPSVAATTGEFEVEKILSVLPPRQRAVMHLTVIEGMSDGEIGRALGIRAGSVRSHRKRARRMLASLLERRATAPRSTHEHRQPDGSRDTV